MSRPALLANENVPWPAIAALRNAGVTVVSVAETMPRASDRAVLAYALVFARASAAPLAIVFVRQGPQPAEAFGRDVLAVLDDADFALGHLVVLAGSRLWRRAMPT